MDLNNDTAYATINVFDNFVQRTPMLEVFTSSTCPPCVQGNINLKDVLSNYSQTDYTLLKYQMSWPGSGDPYYTQEAGDRRTFYSVNSVPRFEIDGDMMVIHLDLPPKNLMNMLVFLLFQQLVRIQRIS